MGDKPATTASNGKTTDPANSGTGKPSAETEPKNPPTDTPPGDNEGDNGQEQEGKTYNRRQLANIVNAQKKKAIEQARAEWEAEQANQKAEADRKAQEAQGQYESLYNTAKSEASALKSQVKELQEQLGTLKETLDTEIDQAITDWPDEILETDPAQDNPDGYTIAERRKWYTRMSKVVAKMGNGTGTEGQGQNGQTPRRPSGNPPSPKPATHSGTESPDAEAYRKKRMAERGGVV